MIFFSFIFYANLQRLEFNGVNKDNKIVKDFKLRKLKITK